MNRSAEIFTATFFSLLAILYLTDRYTSFDMHPLILIIGAVVLILITGFLFMRGVLERNLFSVSIILLTVFMLISLMI